MKFTPEKIAEIRADLEKPGVFVGKLLIRDALAEIERLQEIERKAIEQSEYIQLNGLTEFEVAGLKAENARLRAALQKIYDFDGGTMVDAANFAIEVATEALKGGGDE